MTELKDKIVFISGASAGIGAACARGFAEHGAKLILAARRLDKIQSLAASLTGEFGTHFHAMALDVRDREAVKQAVDNLPSDFREVDILVNNAGLARGLAPIHEGEFSDWDDMIDTNVKGLLNLTRLVSPGMVERNRGHIINIGSIAGRQVYPNGGVYCASKFAERALNQAMAIDFLQTKVRVSTVDPGLVDTEFAKVRFHWQDEERAKGTYKGMQPLTAEDVANAVVWVAQQPQHVNIQELLIMPTDQAGATHVRRDPEPV